MGMMSAPEKNDAQFRLLNYADGIVVCLCEATDHSYDPWLFAIDVQTAQTSQTRRIRHMRRLRRNKKIFVRHNGSFLCYGTHTGTGRDCHREWLVRAVDLQKNEDITVRPVQLRNFAGSDIGSTVCFEIKDGYFYAISNQTGFEDEEIDWTSYYVCLRFPLSDPSQIQWQRIWRRQHREGPISDTWTDLSLRTDESTGQLMIVECRREWLNGSGDNYRTYYTQPFIWAEDGASSDNNNNNDDSTAKFSAWTTPHSASPASAAQSPDTSPLEPVVSNPGIPAYMPLSSYPDDPLAMLLDSSSRPNYEPPKKRLRRHYHPEYSETEPPSSIRKDFIHSRTKFSAYNYSASAFLDLVNDPPPQPSFFSNPPDRLRLRIGARKRKCPIDEDGEETEQGLLYPPEQFDCDGTPLNTSDERFESRGTRLWPPNDAPAELLSLLCPDAHAGKVHAASDERCLVYSTEPPDPGERRQRPIILVSFDPSIRFKTFRRLEGALCPETVAPTPDHDDRQKRVFERDAQDTFDFGAPKCPSSCAHTQDTTDTEKPRIRGPKSSPSWFSVQPAMHLDIDTAYWLR